MSLYDKYTEVSSSTGKGAHRCHSQSCDQAYRWILTRILSKRWSRYAFFRILSVVKRSPAGIQCSQTVKSHFAMRSSSQAAKMTVKISWPGVSVNGSVTPLTDIQIKVTYAYAKPACLPLTGALPGETAQSGWSIISEGITTISVLRLTWQTYSSNVSCRTV